MPLEHDAPLPTTETSRLRGKGARELLPRTALADLVDRNSEFDPVAVLTEQDGDRVEELVPLRYERMLESPFTFFRGSAILQAHDLAMSPSTNIDVQLCGDAHLSNFGIFSSPERRLVFDVNDFDETATGPFEWDVKRFAASVAIAAQHLGHTPRQQERAVLEGVQSYRTSMSQFATEPTMAIWYATADVDALVTQLRDFFPSDAQQKANSLVSRAKKRNATRAFEKLVEIVDGRPRIAYDPPLLIPIDRLFSGESERLSLSDLLTSLVAGYSASLGSDRQSLLSQFTPIDGARKVVGVGSVGTRCFILLMLGKDANDPFFLQIKEAGPSVIDEARGVVSPFTPGDRVVRGQRLMQATPDMFLGHYPFVGIDGVTSHFYMRQLHDNKASIVIENLDATTLPLYARVCGWTLAHAHARGGKSVELAAYMGKSDKFDNAIVSYALSYQHRNLSDFTALSRAVEDGRVVASTTTSP